MDAVRQRIPWLGALPIAEIDAPTLLATLRRIEARGAHETARRTKEKCGQVFRYAIATGCTTRDPSADLRGALAPIVSTSRAAITDPGQVAERNKVRAAYNRVQYMAEHQKMMTA